MAETLDKYGAGELLRKRRENLGLTQEQVVEATTVPVAAYLSELETGKVNVARSKHFASLAKVLKLSEADIRAINPSAVITLDSSHSDPTPTPPDFPPGLQDAVAQFGDGIPELRDPEWQALLAGSRFRGGGPETAEEWLDHLLHLKKYSRPRRK